MNNKGQNNKVYESIDIISQEMANQWIKENEIKITSEQNLDIFDIIKENEVVNSLERKNNKNKTVIETNILNNKKKISTQKKKNSDNNVLLSSIKSKPNKEKNNSKNKNNFENTNSNNRKLLLQVSAESESSSNVNENEDSYSKKNKKDIELNINRFDKKRKGSNPLTRFTIRKKESNDNDNINNTNSSNSISKSDIKEESKSSSNNEKSNDKTSLKLNSSNLINELSKDEKINDLQNSNQTLNTNKYSPPILEILPLSKDDNTSFNFSTSQKKNKSEIKLQKKALSLKNIIVYKPKWTPNYFYSREIFLMHRKERINNIKKNILKKKLEKNNSFQPKINAYSREITNEENTYTPIYLRAIEYQNQKKVKNIMNEKLKDKKIDQMMKSNNSYFLESIDADLIYWRQKNWKKKVEEKKNKSRYKIQKEKYLKEEEIKYANYRLNISTKSKKLAENKKQYFYTTNNTYMNNTYNYINNKKVNKNKKKKITVFERLYQEGINREKKLNDITNQYLNTLFKPNINHSFIINKPYSNNFFNNKIYSTSTNRNKNVSKFFTTNNINNQRKVNITKKSKKNFSIILEDMIISSNKSRNKKNKSENNINSIGSRASKSTSNTLKRISLESKLFPIQNKEISPLNVKLGEIKEADSILSEATNRIQPIESNNNLNNFINKNNENNSNNNSNNNSINNNKIDDKINKVNTSNISNKLSQSKRESKIKNAPNKKYSKEIQFNNINDSNQKKVTINLENEFYEENKNYNNISKDDSLIQHINSKENINNNIPYNSQSFNSINKIEALNPNKKLKINKKKISKIKTIEVLNFNENDENSENILQESGFFGNYKNSNLSNDLTKERENISKNNNKIEKNEVQVEKINFNPYEIKHTISSEDTSSYKENDNDNNNNLAQKLRIIEIKEERNKIDKIIEGKNKKSIFKSKNKEIGLYMLNWKSGVSNSKEEPFCYLDNKGIFYEYFRKK